MKFRILSPLMILCIVVGLPALAEETYDGIEYISGKAGFDKKIKGRLIVSEEKIVFTDKKNRSIFTIPIDVITKVANSIEEDPGSFGRKLALGIFANKKEEFLYVNTQTADQAEAIVFKCKKKTSPGIVAKIRFNMDEQEQNVAPPADSSAVAAQTPPPATGTDEVGSVPAGSLPPAKPATKEPIAAGQLPPAPLETPSFVEKQVGWTARSKEAVEFEWQAVLKNPNPKSVQLIVSLCLHNKQGEVIHRVEKRVTRCDPSATITVQGNGQVNEEVALQADHWTFDVLEVQTAGT